MAINAAALSCRHSVSEEDQYDVSMYEQSSETMNGPLHKSCRYCLPEGHFHDRSNSAVSRTIRDSAAWYLMIWRWLHLLASE